MPFPEVFAGRPAPGLLEEKPPQSRGGATQLPLPRLPRCLPFLGAPPRAP